MSSDSAGVKDAFAKYGGEEGDGVTTRSNTLISRPETLIYELAHHGDHGGGVTWKRKPTPGRTTTRSASREFESGLPV